MPLETTDGRAPEHAYLQDNTKRVIMLDKAKETAVENARPTRCNLRATEEKWLLAMKCVEPLI